MSRKFYEVERTKCNCESCSIFCKFMPGFLLPDDIENISKKLEFKSILTFSEEFLRSSPGALVFKKGYGFIRIPTLVPTRNGSGSCIFYREDNNNCTIHDVSPFSCAFFDSHMDELESNKIVSLGLTILFNERYVHTISIYYNIWEHLHNIGLVAPPPEENRAKMQEYLLNGKQ